MAAARNVSPATIMTLLPSERNLAASLPIVVVLPEPLTPATRMMKGLAVTSSGLADGAGERGTEIGANQFAFQFLHRRGIELALRQFDKGAAERGRRALEPAAQAFPPVFALCAVVHSASLARP